MIAQYVCEACKHKWNGRPGSVTCPACGNLYVKWVSYEQNAKDGRRDTPESPAWG